MIIHGTDIRKLKNIFIIAGPCVLESETMAMQIAEHIKKISDKLGFFFIFKSSFDKANRSSINSYRGTGIIRGVEILNRIKETFNIPIITDVHEDTPIDELADIVDILQTPAFLCRQTNFILKVAKYGLPVNVKKGQFLSPWEMKNVIEKIESTGNNNIMLCERGYMFGYNNLISDMRSLSIMKKFQYPVVFDATHSVQKPGVGRNNTTHGDREYVPSLARAAVGVGVDGIFMETHPNPDKALSDGPNSWPLFMLEHLLSKLLLIDNAVRSSTLDEELLD